MDLHVTSLDEIPEGFRQYYTEETNDDGDTTYTLNAEGVAKKLSKFDQILGEKKKLQDRVAKLEESVSGIDPERYKELEAKAKEAEKQALTKKGDFEKLKKALEDEHTVALGKKDEVIKRLTGQLSKEMVDNKALVAIDKMGGRSSRPLLPHVRAAVQVVEQEGKEGYVVRVLDPDGGYRNNIKTGEPMTIEDLVGELKEDDAFKPLFEDDGRGGSGAPPKSGTGGPAASPIAKGGVIRLTRDQAKDVKAYRAAKEQAAKSGADIVIEEAQAS